MNEETRRLRTFINWPSNAPVDAKRIAKGGFYYLGCGLEVKCFSCSGIIADWSYNDKVMTRHRMLDPNCSFVLNPVLSGNIPITNTRLVEDQDYGSCSEDSLDLVPSASEQEPTSLSCIRGGNSSTLQELQLNTTNSTSERSGMSSESARLATFRNWPVSFIVTPESLVKAGFYYVYQGDKVKCAYCNVIIGRWESGDDPLEEHMRHSPNCSFLQSRINSTLPDSSNGVMLRQGVGGMCDSTMLSLGVQNHSVAKQPNYSSKESRLATYALWPDTIVQSPEHLAEAGFYYSGTYDQVRCFHCDGRLRKWDSEDDPWVEHARWFPDCGFVAFKKGSNFIKNSLENKPPVILEPMHLSNPSSSSSRGISEAQLKELLSSPAATAALQIGMDLSRVKLAIIQSVEETGRSFSSADELIEAALSIQLDEMPYQESEETWGTPLQSPRHSRRSDNSHSDYQSSDSVSTPHNTSGPPAQEIETRKNLFRSPSSSPNASSASEPASKTVTLEEENRRLREARLCKICMDSEVFVVFLPCGHLVTCVICAHSLADCPVCRRTIKATVRTFLS